MFFSYMILIRACRTILPRGVIRMPYHTLSRADMDILYILKGDPYLTAGQDKDLLVTCDFKYMIKWL